MYYSFRWICWSHCITYTEAYNVCKCSVIGNGQRDGWSKQKQSASKLVYFNCSSSVAWSFRCSVVTWNKIPFYVCMLKKNRNSKIFIHSVVCLTIGQFPLPNRVLHWVWYRGSSFNSLRTLVSLRSSRRSLPLLPHLPVTSTFPSPFPLKPDDRRHFACYTLTIKTFWGNNITNTRN